MKAIMTNKDARILICENKAGEISWSLDCEVPASSGNYGSKDQIVRNIPFPGWCRKAIDSGQWVDISAVEVAELKVPAGRRRDFHVVVRGKAVTPKTTVTVDSPSQKWFWDDKQVVVTEHMEATTISYGGFSKVVKRVAVRDDETSVAGERDAAFAAALSSNPPDPEPDYAAWTWSEKRAPLLFESVEYGRKFLVPTKDAVELRQEAIVSRKYGAYTWSCPRRPCGDNGWHWDVTTASLPEKETREVVHEMAKVLKVVPKADLEKRVTVKEVYKPCRVAGGYYYNDVYVDGVQVAHLSAGTNNPYGAYSERRFDSDGDEYYVHHDGDSKEAFSWKDFPVDVFEEKF